MDEDQIDLSKVEADAPDLSKAVPVQEDTPDLSKAIPLPQALGKEALDQLDLHLQDPQKYPKSKQELDALMPIAAPLAIDEINRIRNTPVNGRPLGELISQGFVSPEAKRLARLNMIAQQGKPTAERAWDKLYKGILKPAYDATVDTLTKPNDPAANRKWLEDKASDLWNIGVKRFNETSKDTTLGDIVTRPLKDARDVAVAGAKSVAGFIPQGIDVATAVDPVGPVLDVFAPELGQKYKAVENTVSDLAHQGFNEASKETTDITGQDESSPASQVSEFVTPLAIGGPEGLSIAAEAPKLAEKAVISGSNIATKGMGKAAELASKAAPYGVSAAEAGTGLALGHGHGLLLELAGALGVPGLGKVTGLKDAVTKFIQAPLDKIAEDAKLYAMGKDGMTGIQRVQYGLGEVAKDYLEKARVFAEGLKEGSEDARVLAARNADGSFKFASTDEGISPLVRKIRALEEQAKAATDRIQTLDGAARGSRLFQDLAKYGVAGGITGGEGAAIGAGLAGTSTPPEDTQGMKEGALLGGGLGLGGGALTARGGFRGIDADAIRGRSNIDPSTVSDLPPALQDYLHAHAGLADARGQKVSVLPEAEFLKALTKGEEMTPEDIKMAPAGFYDESTGTAYINKNNIQNGVVPHEVTHALDAASGLGESKYGQLLNKHVDENWDHPEFKKAVQEYEKQLSDNLGKPVKLDKDQVKSELTAALGADIMSKLRPEDLSGGESTGQFLSRKFREVTGRESPLTEQFGFPVTKELRSALTRELYKAGEDAKFGQTKGGPKPSAPEPAEPAPEPNDLEKEQFYKDALAGLKKLGVADPEAKLTAAYNDHITEDGDSVPTAEDLVKRAAQKAVPTSFMPSKHPDAIDKVAMKRKSDGRVFIGRGVQAHWMIPSEYPELRDRFTLGGVDRYIDGWVDKNKNFLDKKQAHARAMKIGQMTKDIPTEYKGSLSSLDFENSKFMPAVPRAAESAEDYVRKSGIGRIVDPSNAKVDVDRARKIAEDFAKLPPVDNSPETKKSYAAFAKEVDAQYKHAVDSGMKFEFTKEDPYKSSADMMADVEKGRLKVYTGGEDHPFTGSSTKDETGLTVNEKFRAVHDLYGHASEGNQFGPQGEERAWMKHAAMFSDEARPAMTSETRGQNSWVNYGPHMFDENGWRGDKSHPNYIPPQDRPFAEQKAALLPREHSEVPEAPQKRSNLSEVSPQPEGDKNVATALPERFKGVSDEHGLQYAGEMGGKLHLFNDPETGSTLAVRTDASPEDLASKVASSREKFGPRMDFMPSSNPRAIKGAAVRMPDGKVYEETPDSPYHMGAVARAANDHSKTWEDADRFAKMMNAGTIQQGFVTHDGEFLSRADALARAQELKQIKAKDYQKAEDRYATPEMKGKPPTGLESIAFEGSRRFMPKDGELSKINPDEKFEGKTIEEGQPAWSIRLHELLDKESAGKISEEESAELDDLHKQASKEYGSFDNWFKSTGGKQYNSNNLFMPSKPNAMGFYSKLEQVAEDKLPNKATAEQILATLKSNGVKPDEMKWTGLDDFLKSNPNPTKQELLNHIRENNVQVKEVVKGGGASEMSPEMRKYIDEVYGRTPVNEADWRGMSRDLRREGKAELADEAYRVAGVLPDATKYPEHQLPGADKGSYRELLLTKPPKEKPLPDGYSVKKSKEGWTVYDDKGRTVAGRTTSEKDAIAAAVDFIGGKEENFTSSHFDEPNILAHVRFNDRTGPNGEKLLHLEEVQSDWHQKGRKEGYKGDSEKKADEVARLVREADRAATPEERERIMQQVDAITATLRDTGDMNAVPDAPFKATWPALAMKRMIRYAAENGYDGISWTNGEQQAARYDLSKQVKNIGWSKADGKVNLWIEPQDGKEIAKEDLTPAQSEEFIGKDITKKIVDSPDTNGVLKGVDLKVGGEGMKGFYDKILPSVANELGKKFGAKVGSTDIVLDKDGYIPPNIKIERGSEGYKVYDADTGFIYDYADTHDEALDIKDDALQADGKDTGKPVTAEVPYLPITPEMKESVMTKGQPLFMPKNQQNVFRAMEENYNSMHPDAIPFRFKRDKDGNVKVNPKGEPLPEQHDYDFRDTPLAKEAVKGIKDKAKQEDAITEAASEKMVEHFDAIKDRPEIMAAKGWYELARGKIKKVFNGNIDDAKLFSELLAATSARTPVRENFGQALDAFNQIKRGEHDGRGQKFLDLLSSLEKGELKDAGGNVVRPKDLKQYLEDNDIMPKQSNGKKFNMNSLQVLRVIAGNWADKAALKTSNFAGNLSGQTLRATIDVWAARNLRRLMGGQRIASKSETGVADKDFHLAQRIYDHAAEKLGMNPDDLQAIMWFAEKDHWEKNGWTDAAGAEKSSFMDYLDHAEKGEDGTVSLKNLPTELLPKKKQKLADLDI